MESNVAKEHLQLIGRFINPWHIDVTYVGECP